MSDTEADESDLKPTGFKKDRHISNVLLAHHSLETPVCGFHLELDFPLVTIAKLLVGFHAIKIDKPLDDVGPPFEVGICDLIGALNNFTKQGMELILGSNPKSKCVQEGNEILGGENSRLSESRSGGRGRHTWIGLGN